MANYNGAELPKMTMELQAMQEKIQDAPDNPSRFREMFAFLSKVFGKEQLVEMIGGDTIKTVDIPLMMQLYYEVDAAYWNDANSAKIESIIEQTEKLGSAMEKLSGVMEVVNAAQGSRQNFRNITR